MILTLITFLVFTEMGSKVINEFFELSLNPSHLHKSDVLIQIALRVTYTRLDALLK